MQEMEWQTDINARIGQGLNAFDQAVREAQNRA